VNFFLRRQTAAERTQECNPRAKVKLSSWLNGLLKNPGREIFSIRRLPATLSGNRRKSS
jgi:hypothetical protein